MSGMAESVALAELVEFKKGVSYKGEFLDQPGPWLLGLGTVRPGGGWLPGKARTYGGPCKPNQMAAPGDLFIALTDITQDGSVLGSPVIVPRDATPAVLTHHVAALRPTAPDRLDLRYAYYALCLPAVREQFRSMATGTTVRAVSPGDAGRVRIPLLRIDAQRKASQILGSLDEKLAHIDRLCRALESLMMHAFKLMFFDPSQSELGESVRLDSLLQLDPPTRLRKGVPVHHVDMKGLSTSDCSITGWATREYSGGSRFQNGDTLFARITPCLENGKAALVTTLDDGEIASGSTEFIVMRPRAGVPVAWAYCLTRLEAFRAFAIANMSGTSGRQRVSSEALRGFCVRAPSRGALRQFGRISAPCLARIELARRESELLRSARFALLMRLLARSSA